MNRVKPGNSSFLPFSARTRICTRVAICLPPTIEHRNRTNSVDLPECIPTPRLAVLAVAIRAAYTALNQIPAKRLLSTLLTDLVSARFPAQHLLQTAV